jgi:hypothetical protein
VRLPTITRLAVCGREPVAHKVDHLCNREAMRTHDRLGTAIAPGGKQFKRASAKVCRAARSYRDRSRHQASGAALILFLKKHKGTSNNSWFWRFCLS